MAINNVTPRAYVLRHPEHDVCTSAAFCGFWKGADGRNRGLVLQFQGEAHTRHLTYKEIERLQRAEEEAVSCTPSTR